jgi:hypothetical protein
MSHPIPSTVRADDLLRHVQDLRSGTYEGAMSRGAKEVVYRRGINLLRPVALEILEEANTLFLNGTGNVQMTSGTNHARSKRAASAGAYCCQLLPGPPASSPLWKYRRLLAVSSHERGRCRASERHPRCHCRVRTASAHL